LSRHAKAVDERLRTIRLLALAAVWAVGLAAGFFAFLSAAARYGCSDNQRGLACRTSGSIAGILLVLAVIAIVTAVTIMAADRPARRMVTIAVAGVVALAVCLVAARSLLATA
jgi:hypothetical protein